MRNYHKYLSPGETDKKWGLYLVTAGQGTIEKGTRYPEGNHPGEYLFNWNKGRILNGLYMVYIAKGKGVFESEYTAATTVNEGTCFMLFPNVWHRYQADPEEGWQEYWLGLKGEVMQNWMLRNCIPAQDIFYHVGHNTQLIGLFLKILNHVRDKPPGLQQIITGIALEILGLVLGTAKSSAPHTLAEKIESAKMRMTEDLEKNLSIPEIAADLAMSYSLFRKAFKNSTGISPGQFRLLKRMEKARELLSATLLPIGEIAALLGFDTVYYFSRIFKIKSGYSPAAYRKKFLLA